MKRGQVIVGLIIALIVLLAVGGTIYYVYLKQKVGCGEVVPDQVQECCDRWAEEKNVLMPGCPEEPGKWVIEANACKWKCPSSDCTTETNCTECEIDFLQSCCNKWTEENDWGWPECIGYFVIKEGKCDWECGICPKLNNIDCMPIVSPEMQKYCSGPYHEWIKENCDISFTY